MTGLSERAAGAQTISRLRRAGRASRGPLNADVRHIVAWPDYRQGPRLLGRRVFDFEIVTRGGIGDHDCIQCVDFRRGEIPETRGQI